MEHADGPLYDLGPYPRPSNRYSLDGLSVYRCARPVLLYRTSVVHVYQCLVAIVPVMSEENTSRGTSKEFIPGKGKSLLFASPQAPLLSIRFKHLGLDN
jgi:hypothetical protein